MMDTLTRQASFAVPMAADALTITAVVATPSPVMRRDAKGVFAEVLDMAGVDLTGLDLPLLDSHDRSTAKATLGRATNFRHDSNTIIADLTFSTADDVAPFVARIRDRTLTHFSIGYLVRKWSETGSSGGRIKRAVAWSLAEVSLVSIPADPLAKSRHMEYNTMPKDITTEDRTDRKSVV